MTQRNTCFVVEPNWNKTTTKNNNNQRWVLGWQAYEHTWTEWTPNTQPFCGWTRYPWVSLYNSHKCHLRFFEGKLNSFTQKSHRKLSDSTGPNVKIYKTNAFGSKGTISSHGGEHILCALNNDQSGRMLILCFSCLTVIYWPRLSSHRTWIFSQNGPKDVQRRKMTRKVCGLHHLKAAFSLRKKKRNTQKKEEKTGICHLNRIIPHCFLHEFLCRRGAVCFELQCTYMFPNVNMNLRCSCHCPLF